MPDEPRKIRLALHAQGYARVAVEKLSLAGDIDLTDAGVPPQLTEALRAASNSTDWKAIGARFALMPHLKGNYFDSLYLRARGQQMHLVIVLRYGSVPLQEQWLRPAFDYLWPIVANIDGLLERFALPPVLRDTGTQLVAAYLDAADPLTNAAASLLNAILAANVVNAGPQCALVVICEAGFVPELGAVVDNWGLFRKKVALELYPPYMSTFLWNVPTKEVRGRDQVGGGTLSPTQLRQTLGGL